MALTQINLKNFRNYSDAGVDTDADLVLILGPNASGKTNFLESIYFLSRLKSFRAPDNLLVKSQEDYFKIAANYEGKNLEIITQVLPRLGRAYKMDDQKIKKLNWKIFATVLFVPSDLNLFDLGPSLRRKFLDQTLSQTSLQYALDLTALDHILKQRSALFDQIFKQQASIEDLGIWNAELARVSINISRLRVEFVDFLNERLNEVYNSLSDFSSPLSLVYKGTGAETESEFLEKLGQYQMGEVRSGQNLYGPHRDDFKIEKLGVENIFNSSRGELRSQVLALKLLQAKYLDAHRHKTIILLDDVFSELDETRRSRLISSLEGHQIFITTTEEHHLPKFEGNIRILNVENDQIKTA
jgi:DNA replication and repair protein RecF